MTPLADLIRPKSLDDIIGQKHLVGPGMILSNLVKHKRLFSMVLYGPPGTGKTSIAYALAYSLGYEYGFLNAVINSKKDFDEMVYRAKSCENFVLIMDEIHRLNKDKQDLLLPYLESGVITLIGMTTSNPYHSINPAIRSRCQLLELKNLSTHDIREGLLRGTLALENANFDDEAIDYIASLSGGDLRYAYNLLEVSYYSSSDFKVSIDDVKKINNKPNLYIDKNEDGYYDVISALQKSIRGSDVNAALHYLARLIEADDLDIIFRRLSVIAYEDIGLANPAIGPRVNAAISACERLGMPEARIVLGEIVIDMALSPKSNTAECAIDNALNDVRMGNVGKIPSHIKNHSKDYKYPHNYKGSYVVQQYLPDELVGRKYFIPKDSSKYESSLKRIYERLEKINEEN